MSEPIDWQAYFARVLPVEFEKSLTEPREFRDVTIPAKKITGYFQVSNDLAMDMGIIPDTRPPSPPLPRRTRFRWWRQRQRENFSIWLYERVSGDTFPNLDDYR